MSPKPVVSPARDEVRAVVPCVGRPAAMTRVAKQVFEEKKP